jgi:hypothetical protein
MVWRLIKKGPEERWPNHLCLNSQNHFALICSPPPSTASNIHHGRDQGSTCWKLFHENFCFPPIWIFKLFLYFFNYSLSHIEKVWVFCVLYKHLCCSFILDWILSTHMLVVSLSSHARVSLIRFDALDTLSISHVRIVSLLFTCVFFWCVQLLF